MDQPTLGAQRVRLDFNPGSDTAVDRIKRAGAAFVDAINIEPGDPRRKALAMTAAEEAAMWGVKAATNTPRQIAPTFAEAVQEGRYKKVSAVFRT